MEPQRLAVRPFFRQGIGRALEHSPDFEASEVPYVVQKAKKEKRDATKSQVWNIEINEEVMCQSSSIRILDVVEKFYGRSNLVNFATALHRIAGCADGREAKEDPRFARLVCTIGKLCSNGFSKNDPYALTCTLWACAKLSYVDFQLLQAIAAEALRQLHECRDLRTSDLA